MELVRNIEDFHMITLISFMWWSQIQEILSLTNHISDLEQTSSNLEQTTSDQEEELRLKVY